MVGTLGVLVAGGAGARLGLACPKALARVGGTTLLERGWRNLAGACDEVVIVAPADLELPLPAVSPDAMRRAPTRVFDPPGLRVPLAAVVAGLQSRPHRRALVLAVDMPFATTPFLAALLALLAGHQAVVPEPAGIPQPLAASYGAGARDLLAARLAAGERSLMRALSAFTDVVRLDDSALERLPDGQASCFNLNTPEDRAEAERRLASREATR